MIDVGYLLVERDVSKEDRIGDELLVLEVERDRIVDMACFVIGSIDDVMKGHGYRISVELVT